MLFSSGTVALQQSMKVTHLEGEVDSLPLLFYGVQILFLCFFIWLSEMLSVALAGFELTKEPRITLNF